MKHSFFVFAAVLAALLLGACCKPEIIGNASNTLRPQETGNWCWAATTQMLAQHFGIAVSQCELANHRFGKSNCCSFENNGETCPKTNDCNAPGWLELEHVGVEYLSSETALAWEDLRKQIHCRKHPMAYAYGTPGVVGHVLIVKGYVTVGGVNYLVLNDPWGPCQGEERLITYAQYENPAGASTHWATWYNLGKATK